MSNRRGMSYQCLRCGKGPTGIRRSKKPGNPRERYLALEAELEHSTTVHLHTSITGRRNLCPACLKQLVEWQRVRPLREPKARPGLKRVDSGILQHA